VVDFVAPENEDKVGVGVDIPNEALAGPVLLNCV
jgi:hypothetical protein